MKDEDADWLIYHLAAGSPSTTADGLARASGFDLPAVEKSLERLERNMLIEHREGRVHVLSINEALLLCQTKHTKDLPYTIENGVIKERKM